MSKTLLTPEGYKKIEKELIDIKANHIPRVNKRVKEALEYGDSKVIEDAKTEQSFYKQRINNLETMLKEAKVIPKENEMISISLSKEQWEEVYQWYLCIKDEYRIEDFEKEAAKQICEAIYGKGTFKD